jgi:hypothetical protein
MGRNHLKGRHGDRNNAVLAAAGFNFACCCDGSNGYCVRCGKYFAKTSARPNTSKQTALHKASRSTM